MLVQKSCYCFLFLPGKISGESLLLVCMSLLTNVCLRTAVWEMSLKLVSQKFGSSFHLAMSSENSCALPQKGKNCSDIPFTKSGKRGLFLWHCLPAANPIKLELLLIVVSAAFSAVCYTQVNTHSYCWIFKNFIAVHPVPWLLRETEMLNFYVLTLQIYFHSGRV